MSSVEHLIVGAPEVTRSNQASHTSSVDDTISPTISIARSRSAHQAVKPSAAASIRSKPVQATFQ